MDSRLLQFYNSELKFMREMGAEFAKEYPKIASRLGLDGFECADPYVERLLEGFAFLAARIQVKLDAEFPRFTRNLLEIVYPHFLAPVPSMAVVEMQPDLSEGALAEGFELPRHTVLRGISGESDDTSCEYRTAHALKLWPLELTEAKYFSRTGAVATLGVPDMPGVKAAIRLRLKTTAGLNFQNIQLDNLDLYLRGSEDFPTRVYEQLIGNCVGVYARPTRKPTPWQEFIPKSQVRRLGFDDDESLLPYTRRSFQGYRLLHEYFAFPERFLFVRLGGLKTAVKRCMDDEMELIVLLNRNNQSLDRVLDASNFALNCTPAVNLFPRRADRIHLVASQVEHHVVPDRTRPLDFEVYAVDSVDGYGTGGDREQSFRPFFSSTQRVDHSPDHAYFSVQRKPRLLSGRQKRYGPRSSYVGSEVYVSLVDHNCAPFSPTIRQLSINTLCTNRDLPLQMPVGQGATDFTIEAGAPVKVVRAIAGPTRPRAGSPEGETAWKLISHLSLNYLSLVDNDAQQGAAGMREFLGLYGDMGEAHVRKQIEGFRSISSRPITGRLPTDGPITFGRGLELSLNFDESAFEGVGVFLLGAVLERFFARYVSLNSFTETVVNTVERGEIMRWPATIGQRQAL
ncbi:MAG: type VI secretion system baseplate subunit TssF [Pseudomonadota bacterium]